MQPPGRLERLQAPALAATSLGAAAGVGVLAGVVVPGILGMADGIPDIVHLLTLGTLAIGMIFIQGALIVVVAGAGLLLAGVGVLAGLVLLRRPGPWRVVGLAGAMLCVVAAVAGVVVHLL